MLSELPPKRRDCSAEFLWSPDSCFFISYVSSEPDSMRVIGVHLCCLSKVFAARLYLFEYQVGLTFQVFVGIRAFPETLNKCQCILNLVVCFFDLLV